MVQKTIRLAKPEFSQTLYKSLQSLLEEGYLVQGKNVKSFEEALSECLNGTYAIAVSSGTAALHLALLSLGIGAGDEVILPAYSFAATVNVVRVSGAIPIFVDIEERNFCIDVLKVESVITDKTVAIMPVHEFGSMTKMTTMMEIANKYQLRVVEDAACALGSEYKEKPAGTFGDIGCFSFHPRKIITTGEGGALVTTDPQIAEDLRRLRSHGSLGGANNENFILAGLNYRMPEIQALLGIDQLKELHHFINVRKKQAALYNEGLKQLEWLELPLPNDDFKHTYQSYQIVVKNGKRDRLREFLRSKGVECNNGAQFLPELGYLKRDEVCYRKQFPNAWKAYSQGLVIPIGHHINEEDVAYVINAIKEFNG